MSIRKHPRSSPSSLSSGQPNSFDDSFYSNARLEHDEAGETVVAVNYFLMNTPIHFTLENFGEFLKLPPGQDPPPSSSSAQLFAPPLSDDMSTTILGAITSLTEEFKGFRTRPDDAFEHINNNLNSLDSRMSRMEENVALLKFHFPPPFPPHQDD
ncbi:hypothetical protein Gotur_001951 [Gossypium turneri]